MGFRCLVRDQEVDGSNPFAPTNLLESATYKMRKSIERLVQGQEVDGSSSFAPTIISPLNSILYAALSTATSGRDLGTTGTAEGFFVENVKPSPTLSATSFLYSESSRSFEYTRMIKKLVPVAALSKNSLLSAR